MWWVEAALSIEFNYKQKKDMKSIVLLTLFYESLYPCEFLKLLLLECMFRKTFKYPVPCKNIETPKI